MALESVEDALDRGDTAPAFELQGTDGETYTLDSFVDREALLVVFTCNHCPYAKARFPAMNAIAADYDEVAVVGINPNDEEQYPEDSYEKMQEYVESGEIDYDAYLRDESQAVAAAYGAVCTPDPFLFRNEGDSEASETPRDGGGETARVWSLAYHGRLDDAPNPDEEPSTFYIRDAIDAVLAGEEVDIEEQPSRGCSIKWKEN